MGWSSGSELMNEVIDIIQPEIKDEKQRKRIYKKLIIAFEDMDADTLDECCGGDPAFDNALRAVQKNND